MKNNKIRTKYGGHFMDLSKSFYPSFVDWFKKATPYQVTKNGKSDVLTPENLEENGKPSTTFKSFDTIDLHEFRKESEAFDYEKVVNIGKPNF